MGATADLEKLVAACRTDGMSDAEIVSTFFDAMEALHQDVGAEERQILRSLSLDEVIHLIRKAKLSTN
jgi:hypothetical protein